MSLYYVTSDSVGSETGGGVVTWNEAEALVRISSPMQLFSREFIQSAKDSVWADDDWMYEKLQSIIKSGDLVHFYAGTFSKTIKMLKAKGAYVTYTCAAHSIEESRKEHESLGIPYTYPHMTVPELWQRYLEGYLLADRLIVPSEHSKEVCISYGADPLKVRVIPHGCNLPKLEELTPPPERFSLGCLGAVAGPDKGLIYLLQAWRKLNYQDATLKIAGGPSNSGLVKYWVSVLGGGNIELMGWIDKVKDFYSSISCYCQPSVSEGFGIEVLEAMAHGRPVICSQGAGASCIVDENVSGMLFKTRDVDDLARTIDLYYRDSICKEESGEPSWRIASNYTWDKMKVKYQEVWKELIS